MSGFEYTIRPSALRRFKSTLEMRWFRYLKPQLDYISYEYLTITPTTPGWIWYPTHKAGRYVCDFFLKIKDDSIRYVTEVKPITEISEFDDYLPKPSRPDYRICLLGVGSREGHNADNGAPGPTWIWDRDLGAWAPWEVP